MINEWISTRIRRPRVTGYYLVYAPDYFDSEQGVAHFDATKKHWSTTWSDTVESYVTHWRKLLPNPK